MTLRITYFVHGATSDNESGIATGWLDRGLSKLGIEQAEELGRLANKDDFAVFFSSDLKRAIDSIKIAFKNESSITKDERLRECNYGDWNGKSDGFKKKMADYIHTSFPNGESYKDVEKRMKNFIVEVKEKYSNKKIAIMAHQAPQLALEVLANGLTWEDAIIKDWRHTKSWQPGWEYIIK